MAEKRKSDSTKCWGVFGAGNPKWPSHLKKTFGRWLLLLFSFSLFNYRFYFLEKFYVHSKTEQKVQSSHTPHPTALPPPTSPTRAVCLLQSMLKHWRRKWQPTPVFLPAEAHGQRSLEGYNPLDRKESDITEAS